MNKEKYNIIGNINYLSDEYILNNYNEIFNNIILTTLSLIDETDIINNSYLDLNLVSDHIIKDINNKYAGNNEITDVLAFPYFNDNSLSTNIDYQNEFLIHSDLNNYIGEIFISYPTALKQSIINKHSVLIEVLILTIHGLLHIFGYDHYEKEEKNIMQSKEKIIFDRVINNA